MGTSLPCCHLYCTNNLDMHSLGHRHLLPYHLRKDLRLPYGVHMPYFHIPYFTKNWTTTQLHTYMINKENRPKLLSIKDILISIYLNIVANEWFNFNSKSSNDPSNAISHLFLLLWLKSWISSNIEHETISFCFTNNSTLTSVSYTHLDVYKRQSLDSCFGQRTENFQHLDR